MDAKIRGEVDQRSTGRRKWHADWRSVSAARDVIELSTRSLDETVFRLNKSLATGVTTRHSCAATLGGHSLAAFLLSGC